VLQKGPPTKRFTINIIGDHANLNEIKSKMVTGVVSHGYKWCLEKPVVKYQQGALLLAGTYRAKHQTKLKEVSKDNAKGPRSDGHTLWNMSCAYKYVLCL
jgi:hypothetical protein